MYKTQRRKSGRVIPYDVASSSTANRKSAQFIPVINYDPSLSSIKLKDKRSSLPNLNKLDSNSISNVNKSVNSNEQTNRTFDNQIEDKNKQLINIQSNKNCSVDNFKDQNVYKPNLIKSIDGKSQEEYEDQFDSEFDKIFLNSSIDDKLNKQLESTTEQKSTEITSDKTMEQSDDENYYLINERDGDELFDSDAINNEDCESLKINDDEDDTCDNLFTYQNLNDGRTESNGLIDNALISKDLGEEVYNDPFGVGKEVDDDDDIDLELDKTLIFKADDPIQSQYIIQPSQYIPKEEDGFRTASGLPVKIKMSLEEQRRRALRLGISIKAADRNDSDVEI